MRKKNLLDDCHKTTPVTITYKFYNDTITMKREVYDLTVRDLMELNRSMIVNVFDEELYRDYVLKMARDIQKKKGFVRRLLDKMVL
jgi:hypothetical protein